MAPQQSCIEQRPYDSNISSIDAENDCSTAEGRISSRSQLSKLQAACSHLVSCKFPKMKGKKMQPELTTAN